LELQGTEAAKWEKFVRALTSLGLILLNKNDLLIWEWNEQIGSITTIKAYEEIIQHHWVKSDL